MPNIPGDWAQEQSVIAVPPNGARTNPLGLERAFVAEDPVYFTDRYDGSDTVLVADVPYEAHPCDERTFEFQDAAE